MSKEIQNVDIRKLTKEEIMALSNDNKRHDFVKKYKAWGIWYEDEKLGIRYFRCEMPDGSSMVVTECRNNVSLYNHPKGEYSVHYRTLIKNGEYYNPSPFFDENEIVNHLKTLCIQYRKEKQKKNS